MSAELEQYLSRQQPISEVTVEWGNGLFLRITAYLTDVVPPLEYVTSVRAIVRRGDSVLAVRDAEGTFHILPGGRCEKGETLAATLHREVLEETGWAISEPSLVGVLHFHHLGPRPADYVYPYPDFMQLVYWAEAEAFRPAESKPGKYEVESRLCPVDQVTALGLPASQQIFLNAVLEEHKKNAEAR